MRFLDENQLIPADLDQALLHGWIDGDRNKAKRIAEFVSWLLERGLVDDIRVGSGLPSEIRELEAHLERVRRLLDAECPLQLGLRAARLLVLLYGTRLSRIFELTTEDLRQQEDATCLSWHGIRFRCCYPSP